MKLSEYQTLAKEYLSDPVAVLCALSDCKEPFLKALQKYHEDKSRKPGIIQTIEMMSDVFAFKEELLSRVPEQYKDKARHLLSKNLYDTVDLFADLVKMSFENKSNWEILYSLMSRVVKSKITSTLQR